MSFMGEDIRGPQIPRRQMPMHPELSPIEEYAVDMIPLIGDGDPNDVDETMWFEDVEFDSDLDVDSEESIDDPEANEGDTDTLDGGMNPEN